VKDLLFENLNIAKILSFLNVYKLLYGSVIILCFWKGLTKIQPEESELYTNDAKSKAVV
jgi:hypothetical protein